MRESLGDDPAPATEAAEQASRDANEAAVEASEAASEAVERAADARQHLSETLAADPLLDSDAHRAHAGVDEQHPLGLPGEPLRTFSPLRMSFIAALGVASAYVLLQAVVAVREVLLLVVVAMFLAVGLQPAVEALMRRGMRRGYASGLVLLSVLIVLGVFIGVAVQRIGSQATDLAHQLPSYLDRLQRGNGLLSDLNKRFDLVNQLRRRAEAGPTFGLQAIGGVVGVGKAVLSAVFSAITVFILTAYFLANLPDIKRGALRLVPRSRRPRVGLILDESLRRIGGYVLGNIATSLAAGVFAFVFLVIAGVPFALALALFVAVLDLVPLVGASIAAVVVTVVAFFVSIPAGIASAVFFLAYQQFENYVLVPRIMKRTVDVKPLATIVAALIGGTLLGVVGALLAIPAAATVALIIDEVVYPRQDEA